MAQNHLTEELEGSRLLLTVGSVKRLVTELGGGHLCGWT